MKTSSKGECEECSVCRLFEIGVQSEECDPPCYKQAEVESEKSTDKKGDHVPST